MEEQLRLVRGSASRTDMSSPVNGPRWESRTVEQACKSCGVTGPPHGSDVDCVAALRVKVDQLNGFVDSLLKQSMRRNSPGHQGFGRRVHSTNSPKE